MFRRVSIIATLCLFACGPKGQPKLDPIDNTVGFVGGELNLALHAQARAEDSLSWSYTSDVPNLDRRADRPSILPGEGGNATFRWRPLAQDVGLWTFEFSVSAGGGEVSSQQAQIEIKPESGMGGPRFVEPLNHGTALDIGAGQMSVDVRVRVEDTSATSVMFRLDPLIPNAELEEIPMKPFERRFRFTPSAAQISARDYYSFTFTADDGVALPATWRYDVVLVKGNHSACVDDRFEENDDRMSISNASARNLAAGDYADLALCPIDTTRSDEDYYRLDIQGETEIVGRLDFDGARGDLDLQLLDGAGGAVRSSVGTGNWEVVRQCVKAPGVYYLRVYPYLPPSVAPTQASYGLKVTRTAAACCADDALEPNDEAPHALTSNATRTTPAVATDLKVCPGNDDFIAVQLTANDRLVVDLTFTQTTAQQDLDLYLYAPDGTTNLTPCCDTMNGQSGDSNEHFERVVATAGRYYVVVRGYNGSTNAYAIRIAIQ